MSLKSNNISNSHSNTTGRPPGPNNTTINVRTNGCGIDCACTKGEDPTVESWYCNNILCQEMKLDRSSNGTHQTRDRSGN